MRRRRGPGWARAADVLEAAWRKKAPHARVSVGRTRHLDEGLSFTAFVAAVEVTPDPYGWSDAYVALLAREGLNHEHAARTRMQAALLSALAPLPLPFRVPEVVSVEEEEDGGLALVQRFIQGIPLDLRAGRQGAVLPWEVVGRVAAAIHALDVSLLPPSRTAAATRRAHAEECLATFDGLGSEVDEARSWARDHLPPPEPVVLLHGDLLGQNILLHPDEPPGVIDWEYARAGDPAYDLAIVTRGVRQPFQVSGGLERLVAAYRAAGGHAITANDVRFHELCLAADWYREAEGEEDARQALALLKRILESVRRDESASSSVRST